MAEVATQAAPAAQNTLSSTAPRTDIAGESWPEGDLPAQGGGGMSSLLPGVDTFLIPIEIAQCWKELKAEDKRQGSPTFGQQLTYNALHFDRAHPLIVLGGKLDGEPMTAYFSGKPRPRGKKDDSATPWVSDLAYVLAVGLQDPRRPKGPDAPAQMKAIINSYAGKPLRLRHGLSAQCAQDRVRYILAQAEGGEEVTIPDPQKVMGCGLRFYSKDFKDPATGGYLESITCDCGTVIDPTTGQPDPVRSVDVVLRGFPSVEEILPPLAQGGQPGGAVPGAASGPVAR